MQERRSLKRRDLVYYLRAFDRRNEQLLGHVANISTGGVMLIGERPIEPDTTYFLEMQFPIDIRGKRSIELEATSRWCRTNGNKELFSTGFELSDIGPDDLDTIAHLCSNPALCSRETVNAKRIFDILGALFGLSFLSPVFLFIVLVLKLESPGAVFFAGKRVGKRGQPFRMHKFRTMAEPAGGSGPKITAHDDPRITRIGRFLRQTKLNELPQLFNVLKGEMSFVGPRPEDAEFVAHYTPEQREVLSVRPGITSLATILYAGEEKLLSFSDVTKTYVRSILPDKLRLDLLYIRNQSLLLDFDILVQTMLVLIPRFRKAAPQVEDILMGPVRMARRYLSWFAIDAAIALLSVSLAGALWRLASPMDVGLGRSLIAALLITALFSLTNWLTGVQRIYWRYANPSEAIGVIGSALAATVLLLITNALVQPPRFPPQMLIMVGIFALSGFLASRYRRSLLQGLDSRIESLRPAATAGRERVLIAGAGDAGQLAVLLLRNNPAGRALQVVGIVDDDIDLLGTLVHRVPVLGICDQIPDIVLKNDIGTIVFAIHNIEKERRQRLLESCRATSARTLVVPDLLTSLLQGKQSTSGTPSVPQEVVDGNDSATQFEEVSMDLRTYIYNLAELARKGDFAGVSEALIQMEAGFRKAESSGRLLVPPPGKSDILDDISFILRPHGEIKD